jgi:hypothetical protein
VPNKVLYFTTSSKSTSNRLSNYPSLVARQKKKEKPCENHNQPSRHLARLSIPLVILLPSLGIFAERLQLAISRRSSFLTLSRAISPSRSRVPRPRALTLLLLRVEPTPSPRTSCVAACSLRHIQPALPHFFPRPSFVHVQAATSSCNGGLGKSSYFSICGRKNATRCRSDEGRVGCIWCGIDATLGDSCHKLRRPDARGCAQCYTMRR